MITEKQFNSTIQSISGDINGSYGLLARAAGHNDCSNDAWSSPCGNFGGILGCNQDRHTRWGQERINRTKARHNEWISCMQSRITSKKQELFDFQAEYQREQLQKNIDKITAEIRKQVKQQEAQIVEVNPVVTEQVILTHGTQDIEPSPKISVNPPGPKEVNGNNIIYTAAIAGALFLGLPILQRALK